MKIFILVPEYFSFRLKINEAEPKLSKSIKVNNRSLVRKIFQKTTLEIRG